VIFALTESPKEAGLIWVGTNDGLVQVTRDGGKNWSNVTKNLPDLPEWGTVDNIEASRYDAATAYLTVDGHQVNVRDPFVYKNLRLWKNLTLITGRIPAQHAELCTLACAKIPCAKGLLYLGTERGCMFPSTTGRNWQPLQSGLPHAPVYWLTVQERFHDLAVATYGRRLLDSGRHYRARAAYAGGRRGQGTSVCAAHAYRFKEVRSRLQSSTTQRREKIHRTARPLISISSPTWEKRTWPS